MAHDLWPFAKTSLATSFQFRGRTRRAHFWAWTGILHLLYLLAYRGEFWLMLDEQFRWPGLMEALTSGGSVKFALERISDAWPSGFTLTAFPLGSIGFKFSRIPTIMPLLVLVNLIWLAPVTRRARDAGYSPKLVIVLLYWAAIAPIVVTTFNFVLALAIGIGAMVPTILLGSYLGTAHQTISLLAALAALYMLSAPSKLSPNPTEATP